MLQEKDAKPDDLAAPTGYVTPPTGAYVLRFRKVCKNAAISISCAVDTGGRDFALRMAEGSFFKRAWTHTGK